VNISPTCDIRAARLTKILVDQVLDTTQVPRWCVVLIVDTDFSLFESKCLDRVSRYGRLLLCVIQSAFRRCTSL
jgi:hypothetical protein